MEQEQKHLLRLLRQCESRAEALGDSVMTALLRRCSLRLRQHRKCSE